MMLFKKLMDCLRMTPRPERPSPPFPNPFARHVPPVSSYDERQREYEAGHGRHPVPDDKDRIMAVLARHNVSRHSNTDKSCKYSSNTRVWRNGRLVDDGRLSHSWRIRATDSAVELTDSAGKTARLEKSGTAAVDAGFSWTDFDN